MRSFGRLIAKLIDDLLDRVFAVIGAISFAQFPQLIQQYIDLLTGAIVESQRLVRSIREQAELNGRTIEEFIARHLNSGDPDFVGSGRIMQQAVDRLANYELAYRELSEASIWQKPFLFVRHLDQELFAALNFRPGLPLTVEGLVYAAVGLLLAYLFYNLILKLPLQMLIDRARPRKGRQSA